MLLLHFSVITAICAFFVFLGFMPSIDLYMQNYPHPSCTHLGPLLKLFFLLFDHGPYAPWTHRTVITYLLIDLYYMEP